MISRFLSGSFKRELQSSISTISLNLLAMQRILPTSDLEARVESLEKQIEREENGAAPDGNSPQCFVKGPEAAESNRGTEVVEARPDSSRDETRDWMQAVAPTEEPSEANSPTEPVEAEQLSRQEE